MSGHTPGKWRVCTLAHPEDRTVVVYGPSFSDPVATGIARAGIDASEAHANARLIAAAPDLLAALKALLVLADEHGWGGSAWDDGWIDARAAISKAEGES